MALLAWLFEYERQDLMTPEVRFSYSPATLQHDGARNFGCCEICKNLMDMHAQVVQIKCRDCRCACILNQSAEFGLAHRSPEPSCVDAAGINRVEFIAFKSYRWLQSAPVASSDRSRRFNRLSSFQCLTVIMLPAERFEKDPPNSCAVQAAHKLSCYAGQQTK